MFLPLRGDERDVCEQIFERVVREEGQHFLGWRDSAGSGIGLRLHRAARDARGAPGLHRAQPEIEHRHGRRGPRFERKLYVIRRRVENEIRALDLAERDLFYVCSLSSLTIVYKGQLISTQIPQFYPDLLDPALTSALAMVHQRFSTNTFPSWDRAHPYRFLCHNGEINTLRGNINWMHAREKLFSSPLFGDDIKKLLPIIQPTGSDSAMFDNALELLVAPGVRWRTRS